MKRSPTKFTGVYQRGSSSRRCKGKPDICYDITYKADGKKVWEKVGWASEGYSAKLADQVRSERIRSIRHNEELPTQRAKAPYFEDVAKLYVGWAEENKSSWQSDKSRIEGHLLPTFKGKRLNEISPFDLERLKSDLMKGNYKPATVKHCLVLVRMIYNKAIAWDKYSGNNPIKGVTLPRLQNSRERFLSFEEAETLLQALMEKSKTLHDISLLSLHCGLRFGEIANLKGHDIDLENGIISIADPKNGEARKAYMTDAVRAILEIRKPAILSEYIFPDKRNRDKMTGVSCTFRKVVKALGLNNGVDDPRQWITFHSLRHTFASWLALQGESLLTIRELLGHKSFEMTKRYAHLIPDEKKKAAARLEQAFMKGRGSKEEVMDNN